MREHSQHIDELAALLAQPGAHDLTPEARLGGAEGLAERNGLPTGNDRAALLLTEAALELARNRRSGTGEQQCFGRCVLGRGS